jgi:FkbM family methyltransferase
MKNLSSLLMKLGNRIVNLSYILENPSYQKVRNKNACPDLYKLLNKNWFPAKQIKTVLDVGTNEGQFMRTSLALLPNATVYGFEANPKIAKTININEFDSNKVKILNVACGSKRSTLPMYISKFSPSSSLLPIADDHIQEFPGTGTDEIINVPVERLDTIIQSLDLKDQGSYFLKIDVQGYEMEVLEGATGILNETIVILCEVNIAPLYQNQCNLESILSFMNEHKFDLVDLGEPFRAKATQNLLYLDLVFLKKGQLEALKLT